MSTADEEAESRAGQVWLETQRSADFVGLRKRFRRFVFPMTVVFLIWFEAYVLLSGYAPDFMATKLVGYFNVGLLFGLLQFVTTFVITIWYVRFANRKLDPAAEAIRNRLEGETEK